MHMVLFLVCTKPRAQDGISGTMKDFSVPNDQYKVVACDNEKALISDELAKDIIH
jgi:hypothetical protein